MVSEVRLSTAGQKELIGNESSTLMDSPERIFPFSITQKKCIVSKIEYWEDNFDLILLDDFSLWKHERRR
jgi:hypothetical protein